MFGWAKGFWLAACFIGLVVAQPGSAVAAVCGPNQVYSASMEQCIPKITSCAPNQVFSASLGQCIQKIGLCRHGDVYSSILGQCIPKISGRATTVFFPHGCPYNLDKSCIRTPSGQLIHCRCIS
jgi:hypothetical protein